MIRQIWGATIIGLQGLPQRLGLSLIVVVGSAGVVTVLMGVLAVAIGLNQSVISSVRPNRVIVIRGGAMSEMASALTRQEVHSISDSPGILRSPDGDPIAAAEALAMVNLRRISDNQLVDVTIRGIDEKLPLTRPEVRIISGRMFSFGTSELIAGKSAALQYKDLNVGSKLSIRGSVWSVVGVFDSKGDMLESELLGDVISVMAVYRHDVYQSVSLILDGNLSSFSRLKDSLTSNPAVSVEVMTESDYYDQQSAPLRRVIFIAAYFVGGFMALGAIFGALNTMYSSVSARLQELATLRAIGFRSESVVVSIIAEALLLSGIGGCLGVAIAWIFLQGKTINTRGGTGVWSQIIFHLQINWALMLIGIILSLGIGLIGGLLPAVRAARTPVATALRNLN